jgi:hypothetical protein
MERMLGREIEQFRYQGGVPPEVELGIEAVDGRFQPFLLQSHPDPLRPCAGKASQGSTPPETLGLLEQRDRLLKVPIGSGGLRLVAESPEDPEINFVDCRIQRIRTR